MTGLQAGSNAPAPSAREPARTDLRDSVARPYLMSFVGLMVASVVQRCEFEISEFRFARSRSVDTGAQHQEIASYIVVIS